jgi:hypothetical protein
MKDINGIRRELFNLEEIGLLMSIKKWNMKYYAVKKDFSYCFKYFEGNKNNDTGRFKCLKGLKWNPNTPSIFTTSYF